MEPLQLLSLGAIAIAITACILVYVFHRQTTKRLDALTHANLGITHTIHRLIASSLPPPPHPTSAITNNVDVSSNDIERITVSDDDEIADSDVDSGLDSDIESDQDSASVSDNDNESDVDDSVNNEVDNNHIHNIKIDAILFSNQRELNVKELKSYDLTDDDEDLRNVSESESENESDNDIDITEDEHLSENDLHLDVVKLDDNPAADDAADDVADDAADDAHDVADDAADNDVDTHQTTSDNGTDLIAFILSNVNSNSSTNTTNFDINVVQIKDKSLSNEPSNVDVFKHTKVEELRKMAVEKLNMSEDEAKKLKKPQLVQLFSK